MSYILSLTILIGCGIPSRLVTVIGVEDQASHLNALAGRDVVRGGRVGERGVRDAAGAAVGLGVEALDEEDLLGGQAVLVEPAVARAVADAQGLAAAVRVDEGDGDELLFADRRGLGDSQRVSQHGLDRAPYVDDLDAPLEKLRGFLGGEMVRHAG